MLYSNFSCIAAFVTRLEYDRTEAIGKRLKPTRFHSFSNLKKKKEKNSLNEDEWNASTFKSFVIL